MGAVNYCDKDHTRSAGVSPAEDARTLLGQFTKTEVT